MDIFKKKSDRKEKWYFPVSSTSYFTPFKKGTYSDAYDETEQTFEKYTQTLLSLKLYYTKQTQKNLQMKKQQEEIIKILKDNIIENIFNKINKLEDNKSNLNQKIKECEEQQNKIEEIKNQIQYEDILRKQIEENYKIHLANKLEIENDLKKINEDIQEINRKIKSVHDEIKILENKNIKPEEVQSTENTKKQLQDKIDYFEKQNNQIKVKIDNVNKKRVRLNITIDEIKKKLADKESIIKSKNEAVNQMTNALEEVYIKEQKRLQEEKKTLEKELKEFKDNAIRHFLTIKIINEEIEKLTLNKSTINSVSELIEQLSLNKKYIDNRKCFNEIREDYQKIDNEINQSNNQNDIYKKYGLDADSIRKIEKSE